MGVTGKVEVEVDIKSKGDVFHELFISKPHEVSTIVPDTIHGCDLHDGDFGKVGSIIQWEYTLDGKKCVAKQIIEAIDEEKKISRFKLVEGSDLLKEYKSMTLALHVIPKGEFDAVMLCIEFERLDDFGPYPTNVMDMLISLTRDVEAHHVNDA